MSNPRTKAKEKYGKSEGRFVTLSFIQETITSLREFCDGGGNTDTIWNESKQIGFFVFT